MTRNRLFLCLCLAAALCGCAPRVAAPPVPERACAAPPATPAEAEALLPELAPLLRLPYKPESSMDVRLTDALLVFETRWTRYEYRRPAWMGHGCSSGNFWCNDRTALDERVAVEEQRHMVVDLARLEQVRFVTGGQLELVHEGGRTTRLAASGPCALLRLADSVRLLAPPLPDTLPSATSPAMPGH